MIVNIFIMSYSAISTTLGGMLFGRFLVGIGMGLGPPIASLYVAEVKILGFHPYFQLIDSSFIVIYFIFM